MKDAYAAEFEDELSDDDDRWVGLETDIHHAGIPKVEEKEVQKEVGQESLKLPLDIPTLSLECAHRVETECPLLKLMSVLSLVNEIYYSKEKQIIHIEDVVHQNQRPFEEADNVRNGQVDSRMNGEVMDRVRNEEEEVTDLFLGSIENEDYSFTTDQSIMLIGNSHTFEEDSCQQQMEDLHANAHIMVEFCHFKRTSKQMSKEDAKIAKQQLQQQGLEDDSSIMKEIEDDDIYIGNSNLDFNSDSVSILDLDSTAILDAKTNSDADFNGSRGKLDEERLELMMYDIPRIQHIQRSVDQVPDHGKVKKRIQEDFQELARGQNPLHDSFRNLDQKEFSAIKFIQEDSTKEFFAINEQAVLSNNKTQIFAIRFVQEDFMKIGVKLDEVHQNMFLTKCYYVQILEGKVKLQESLLAYYSDRRSQMAFQTFMSRFVEVAEGWEFHFEAFKDVILMTNVQFNFGDVLVVESGADLTGLWSTLGQNGSDILCFKSIQLVVWQEHVLYYYAVCLQDQFVSKMFWKIRLDSKTNFEVELSSVTRVQSILINRLVSFYFKANSYAESDADAYANFDAGFVADFESSIDDDSTTDLDFRFARRI
ncbi:hypothetical protein L7F22_038574 [Adiantum nelumboides]|nr:hypothetical protein [Adiantum nelumboides]